MSTAWQRVLRLGLGSATLTTWLDLGWRVKSASGAKNCDSSVDDVVVM